MQIGDARDSRSGPDQQIRRQRLQQRHAPQVAVRRRHAGRRPICLVDIIGRGHAHVRRVRFDPPDHVRRTRGRERLDVELRQRPPVFGGERLAERRIRGGQAQHRRRGPRHGLRAAAGAGDEQHGGCGERKIAQIDRFYQNVTERSNARPVHGIMRQNRPKDCDKLRHLRSRQRCQNLRGRELRNLVKTALSKSIVRGALAALVVGVVLGTTAWLGAQSLSFTSGQNISPAFEGWEQAPDGARYFLFGYMNRNWAGRSTSRSVPTTRSASAAPTRGSRHISCRGVIASSSGFAPRTVSPRRTR